MDIYGYNKEADNIDEIQEEDRQEKMAKEKARASHFRYLRHEAEKKTANAEKTSQSIKTTNNLTKLEGKK